MESASNRDITVWQLFSFLASSEKHFLNLLADNEYCGKALLITITKYQSSKCNAMVPEVHFPWLVGWEFLLVPAEATGQRHDMLSIQFKLVMTIRGNTQRKLRGTQPMAGDNVQKEPKSVTSVRDTTWMKTTTVLSKWRDSGCCPPSVMLVMDQSRFLSRMEMAVGLIWL